MLKGGLSMVKRAPQNTRARSVDLYLHALLLLTDHGQQADTGDVATRVGVSPAAASRMMKNLARKKLVRLEPYQGAELTPEGLHQAVRVVRRHRLLEVFLSKVMGFDLRESHARALRMQPTVDEVFEEKLDVMLGRPKFDPHGQPIPAKNITWPRLADSPILDLATGTSGLVSRVKSEDGEAINYLESQGVRPGASVILESIAPFDGPIAVCVSGRVLYLGRRLAELINVQGSPAVRAAERKGRRSRKATCPSSNDVQARTLEASKSAPKFGRQPVLAPAKEI
jgi:DtxR family transcriptional regulator, Mn-dependent transcriptional regulator